MNMTLNKLSSIIAGSLAGIALVSSCFAELNAQESKQKQGKARVIMKGDGSSRAARETVFSPEEKNSLNVTRDGQNVTITWSVDTTGGKIDAIHVLRSPAGVRKHRRVAELKPVATSFTDCLPDEKVHWYWIRLIDKDKKFQEIGPVRAESDKAGASRYINLDARYKATVTRTDDHATITWDFPEDDYKTIELARYQRIVSSPFQGNGGKPVGSLLEMKAQFTDELPEPNSEYWYWFRITMKSGAIIYRGPLKAEYERP